MNPKAKKIIRTMAVLVAILSLIAWGVNLGYQVNPKDIGYDPQLVGVSRRITWDWVNLRELPKTNQKWLGKASHGDIVTLTGRTYEDKAADELRDRFWVECTTQEGNVVWITQSAITPQYY